MAQALDHPILPLTFVANGDLTDDIHKLAKFTSGEAIGRCVAGGAGFLGVLYKVEHDPAGGAAGDECNVMVEGVAVVRTGAAMATPGTKFTSDIDGKAVAAVSTNTVCGITLEAAAGADEYIACLIVHGGVLA
jgi:hypothetical protein